MRRKRQAETYDDYDDYAGEEETTTAGGMSYDILIFSILFLSNIIHSYKRYHFDE